MSSDTKNNPFDFTKRIILPVDVVRRRLMRGEGMNVFLDLETSGLDRQDVPYATPNYAFLSEAAFTVRDLHGNYYRTDTIYPRQPADIEGDIAAKLVTRMQGHEEWTSEQRVEYMRAGAAMVKYLRDVESSYGAVAEHYGVPSQKVSFRDYNRAFHNNDDLDFESEEDRQKAQLSKKALPDKNGLFYKSESGWCYDVQGWDPKKDEIVSMGRFHADRGQGGAYAVKVSEQAFLPDGTLNPEYGYHDNGFYIDEETGEKYVWVGRALGIDIFNAPYDTKVFAANLQRWNYAGQDAAMLYARAMRGPRQEGRWYVRDAMELARAVAKHGPQDESGLKFGEYYDFKRGRVNRVKTQAAFLDANTHVANPMRLIRPGVISPEDGSLHDKHKDHDGAYDTVWGSILDTYARQIAPELAILQDQMVERDNQDTYLNAQDPEGNNWPFFVLPVKKGREEQDGVYLYLGSDVNAGDMNKRIFLRLDEDLSAYKDMYPEDWADFIRNKQNTVKQEKKGEHHLPLSLEYVRKHSSAGESFRGKDPQILKNLKLIGENPALTAGIMGGIEIINRERRFEGYSPAVPLPEDENFLRYATGVNFQDYHRAFKEQERMASDPKIKESIRATRDMMKKRMDDDFQYMTKVSRAIMYMAGLADMIDAPLTHEQLGMLDQERDEDGMLTPSARKYREYFHEYKEKCTRLFADVLDEQNDKPYVKMLRSIKRPSAEGLPRPSKKDYYFDPEKKKFNIYNLADAWEFRNQLCKKILQDRATMMEHDPDHPHLQGYANVDDFKTRPGHYNNFMILPDPSPGEKQGSPFGAPPFIRDKKTGHRIEPEDIARLSAQSDGRDIIQKMVDDGSWEIVFYSFRSDALIKGVMKRCMSAGRKDLIPDTLKPLYVEDWVYRKLGFPNEEVSDSRIPTLRTQERDLKAIMAGAKNSRTLERAPQHLRRTIDMVMKYEEGPRIAAEDLRDIQDKIKQAEKVRDGLHISRYHKETGLPYDFIKYQIDRDSGHNFLKDPNYVVLDVSVWQMRQALENMDVNNGLPLRGIAVPNIPKYKKEAIQKGKPVLFRVEETGQIYSGGKVTLVGRPLGRTGGLQDIFQAATQHLDDAGKPLKQKDKLYYLGIDKLMPVAGTRHVDYAQQTILMPNSKWYSLTAPELFEGSNPNHIVTHIAPADYVRQHFELNKPLLLCHSDSEAYAEMFGDTTDASGHTYMTTLEDGLGINKENGKVEGITLGEFEERIRSHDIDERYVEGAGFLSADHFNAVRNQWTTKHGVAEPDKQKVVALTFQRVNKLYEDSKRKDETKNDWGFAPLSHKPEAAMRIDGEHYPPNPFENVHSLEG